MLRPGDWISRFEREIGRAGIVLVVFTEAYLRSVYCMRELLHLYNSSLGDRENFLQRLVPAVVGDLGMSRGRDRAKYIRYWKAEYDELSAALADLDHASVGDADRRELLLIKDFQHRVSDILAWVDDVPMPRGQTLETDEGLYKLLAVLWERARTAGHPEVL